MPDPGVILLVNAVLFVAELRAIDRVPSPAPHRSSWAETDSAPYLVEVVLRYHERSPPMLVPYHHAALN